MPPPTTNWEIEKFGYFYGESRHRINTESVIDIRVY